MKVANSRPAAWESNTSRAESTAAAMWWARDSAQRSSTLVVVGAAPGDHPAVCAYRTWNDTVLQYVDRVLRQTSAMAA